MKTAPLTLKARILKAKVIETMLCECVTWTLSAQHFGRFRSVDHQVLLRVIGFQRRQRADYTILSYAKALKKTRCESIETTIRKRRLFFAGGRGAAKQPAIIPSGDARNDDRWGGPEIGWRGKDGIDVYSS